MYSKSPGRDLLVAARAISTNLVARFAPASYIRLTGQTGRGRGDDDPVSVAEYCRICFADYLTRLTDDRDADRRFLWNKRVLEYGPGDMLGVALLLYAHGAARVDCVDRFPLKNDVRSSSVYEELMKGLAGAERERAHGAFRRPGDFSSGFNESCIRYFVNSDGLVPDTVKYHLILSRAVLEHTNKLNETIKNIASALEPNGLTLHQVDLRSHGLDRYHEFDFLTWPAVLYKLMYGAKGFPNRYRVNAYREFSAAAGLASVQIEVEAEAPASVIRTIKPYLAPEFASLPSEDLRCRSFWIRARRA